MADVELVGSPDDGDFLHGAEVEGIWEGNRGAGVLARSLTATVTESDMNITLPAFVARVPDGTGGAVLVDYPGGTLTVTTADVNDPRIDIIVLDSSGTASISAGTPTEETGDVEEAPMPSLGDDEILIARVRVENGVTAIAADKIKGRAVNVLAAVDLQTFSESIEEGASPGTAYTIDVSAASVHDVTLDDDCTFTFSNPPPDGRAGAFTLVLRQDGTGGHSVAWPASVDWPGGSAPSLSTSASSVDVLTFITLDEGTTWLGMLAGAAFS